MDGLFTKLQIKSKSTNEPITLNEDGCDSCPYNQLKILSPKMKPTGSNKPRIYILGEAPGKNEDQQGKQFVGKAGQTLRACLPSNTPKEWIRWNNVVRCFPPGTPTNRALSCCLKYLIEDIERTKPKVIIGFGAIPLQALLKENTITNWRGRQVPIKVGNHACWYFPCLHPSYVNRMGQDYLYDCFKNDIWEAIDKVVMGMGTQSPIIPTTREITSNIATYDAKRAKLGVEKLQKIVHGHSLLALDIEANTLRPYHKKSKILSIAFTNTNDETIALEWCPIVADQVYDILTKHNAGIIIHNLAYELEWFYHVFDRDKRILWRNWEDTQAQAFTLDERKRCHSLDFLTLEYFGFRIKSVYNLNRKRLEGYSVKRLLEYNGLDSKWTMKLYHKQKNKIGGSLFKPYRMYVDRTPALVSMQAQGLDIDFNKVEHLRKKFNKELLVAKKKLSKVGPIKNLQITTGKPFNPCSPAQVSKLFYSIGSPLPNTREETLDKYRTHEVYGPIISAILKVRGYEKLLSTYLNNLTRDSALVYPDGKIHTQYNGLFVSTGRLSSEEPNVQNFPIRKHPEIREVIVAPNGWKLLKGDYKQIEVCVLAMASKDRKLIDAITNGVDIHWEEADALRKIYPGILDHKMVLGDKKKLRTFVKSEIVFASFYGSYPKSISKRIGIPDKYLVQWQSGFWDRYKGVKRWQREVKHFYDAYGYIETLNGRRRRMPLEPTILFNSPIQGSASDITIAAMIRLCKAGHRVVLNIHDDLTTLIEDSPNYGETVDEITQLMLMRSFDWMITPISVELSIGQDWNNLGVIGTYSSEDF